MKQGDLQTYRLSISPGLSSDAKKAMLRLRKARASCGHVGGNLHW